MVPGSHLRGEPQGEVGLRFQHQGVAASPRQPAELVVSPTFVASEPVVVRRRWRGWWWAATFGAFALGVAVVANVQSWPEAEVLRHEVTAERVLPAMKPPVPPVEALVSSETISPAPPQDPVEPISHDAAPRPPAPVEPRKIARARPTPKPSPPASPATSEVSLGRVTTTGSLSTATVRAAVSALTGRLQECHARSLEHGVDIKGELRASMAIRSGRVESIDLQTTIKSVPLRACFRQVLVSATFFIHEDNADGPGGAYTDARLEFFLLARKRAKL